MCARLSGDRRESVGFMTPRWLWEHDEYAAYLGECECWRCFRAPEPVESEESEQDEEINWGGVDNL